MAEPNGVTGTSGRQQAIYLGGLRGQTPTVPLNMTQLEGRARQKMSAEAHAYIACGAGFESTLYANQQAFERQRIVPRMLRDVSELDTGVELFGRRLPGMSSTPPLLPRKTPLLYLPILPCGT